MNVAIIQRVVKSAADYCNVTLYNINTVHHIFTVRYCRVLHLENNATQDRLKSTKMFAGTSYHAIHQIEWRFQRTGMMIISITAVARCVTLASSRIRCAADVARWRALTRGWSPSARGQTPCVRRTRRQTSQCRRAVEPQTSPTSVPSSQWRRPCQCHCKHEDSHTVIHSDIICRHLVLKFYASHYNNLHSSLVIISSTIVILMWLCCKL